MEEKGISLNTTMMSSLEHDLSTGHVQVSKGRTLGKKLDVIYVSHQKM